MHKVLISSFVLYKQKLSKTSNYFGFGNFKLGLATYIGKTQSTLYHGLDNNDEKGLSIADSSVVGISMFGLDATYKIKGFHFKSQYILANISNTDQYNTFTGSDMGSALMGYYLELAYDLFHTKEGVMELLPFFRYENYNTHHKTEGSIATNQAFRKTEITFGLGWKMAKGAIIKADYQIINSSGFDDSNYQLNMGVGIGF